jgi:chitinase
LGAATQLEASITGGETDFIVWDFGDGNSGSGITATHTYTAVGIYTATVTAINAANSVSDTTTVYVGNQVVEVRSNFFDSDSLTVPVGSTIIWVLRQGFHSVTADDGSFEQSEGGSWPPFVQTFNSNATVDYYCTVHGAAGGAGMAGQVIVGTGNEEPTEELLELRLPSIVREEE